MWKEKKKRTMNDIILCSSYFWPYQLLVFGFVEIEHVTWSGWPSMCHSPFFVCVRWYNSHLSPWRVKCIWHYREKKNLWWSQSFSYEIVEKLYSYRLFNWAEKKRHRICSCRCAECMFSWHSTEYQLWANFFFYHNTFVYFILVSWTRYSFKKKVSTTLILVLCCVRLVNVFNIFMFLLLEW